jgi:hypothetical protein
MNMSELFQSSQRYKIFGLNCFLINSNCSRLPKNFTGNYSEGREMIGMRIRIPSTCNNATTFRPSFFLSLRPEHVAHHAPYDARDNFLEIETRKYPAYTFASFNRVEKKRLMAPYDTRCVSYASNLSQAACHHKCVSKSFFNIYQCYPSSTPADSGACTIDPRNVSASMKKIQKTILNACRSICPDDCDQVNHYMKRLTETPYPYWIRFWNVKIMSQQQAMRITYSAQMSFFGLVSVYMNAASFWLLFCPLTFWTHRKVVSFLHI